MRNCECALATLLLTMLAAGAAAEERTMILNSGNYASAEAARKDWRPMNEFTPPVEVASVRGKRMLALPCNFTKHDHWRVAWDLQGRWNLAACREISVVASAQGDQGVRMTVYFQSGGGWYRGRLHVPAGGGTVSLSPRQFKIEGRPAGWHTIETVRLSVSRGEEADRSVYLGELRAVLGRPWVAVCTSAADVRPNAGLPYLAGLVADSLDRIGVEYELVDEKAVVSGRLAGKKVAILPLNPALSKAAAQEIRKFVADGGKLLVCYHLPDPLGELLGLHLGSRIDGKEDRLSAIVFQDLKDRPRVKAVQHSRTARQLVPGTGTRAVGFWADGTGKLSQTAAVTRNQNGYFVGHVFTRDGTTTKDPLLREMIGALWPGTWQELYDRQRAQLGQVAGLKGTAELSSTAMANVATDANRRKAVTALLGQARSYQREAEGLLKKDAAGAYEAVVKAQETWTRAFASSVPSRAGEFRAVWCHSPQGVRGRSWEEAIRTLADSGFNTLIVNMCWGGAAAYESQVLPVVDVVRTEGDQLERCLAAAKKRDIAVHVWRVNWFLTRRSPEAFRKRLREAGRLQQDARGQTLDWLCPSHPDNRKLELDSMLEIVRNYDVAGIHFDYIRYPGGQGCYCPTCRGRFEAEYKVKVKNWPDDVITGKLREDYLQFRRDNITTLVAAVSRQARAIKPKVQVSAAVFPHWPSARNDVGQDWKLWVEKGYLDFVCPMQYTRSAAHFDEMTTQTLEWTGGRIPLLTGIGATLGLTSDGTLEQVLISRRRNAAGFVLFDYQPRLADDHLPLLRLGATAK